MSNTGKNDPKSFELHSDRGADSTSSSTFIERSRNIFSCIDKLEKKPSSSSLHQPTKSNDNPPFSAPTSSHSHKETECFRNRESIFKLSDREESGWPPSNKAKSNAGKWERGRDQDTDFTNNSHSQGFKRPFPKQRLPDYVKHPTKYTKYSLSDVPNVNDRSNTHAALSFLKELEERKQEHTQEEKETSARKIMFKKPKDNTNNEIKNTANSVDFDTSVPCTNSRRVLPEAVVGRSTSFRASKNIRKSLKNDDATDSANSRKNENVHSTLSHLMFEEEDC